MGIFEKEIVFYVLGWLFRWLGSNDKNKKAKAVIKKKGRSSL